MKKPRYFFYQFPTGGPKYTLWPLADGTHRLEVDGQQIGIFNEPEGAAVAASKSLLEIHPDPSLASTAEKMLDLDWWERSASSRPLGVVN